jgi:sortase A
MTARAQWMPDAEPKVVPIRRSGPATMVCVKAWLAQRLIASAWHRSLANGTAVKPWPWADVFPVAKLEAPRQQVTLTVLAGEGARRLDLGPGHIDGTPLPGDPGNAVIRGHRDTHFSFLRVLRSTDTLVVHSASGRVVRYVVSGIEVVRSKDVRMVLDAGADRLTLVTCYPFDSALPRGPLRYVVVATRRDDVVSRI